TPADRTEPRCSDSEAGPKVVPRDVDVRAAWLLRTPGRAMLVDVRPEQVLRADEGAGCEFEDQELVRRCPVGEPRCPGEWRKPGTGRRAEQQCRVRARLDARPAGGRK